MMRVCMLNGIVAMQMVFNIHKHLSYQTINFLRTYNYCLGNT